jgi:hypothetical protein
LSDQRTLLHVTVSPRHIAMYLAAEFAYALSSIDRLYIIGVYISINHSCLVQTTQIAFRPATGNPVERTASFFSTIQKGGSLLPTSCRLRASSATHLCGPVPARNADPKSNGQTLRGAPPLAPASRFPNLPRCACADLRSRSALSIPLRSIARVGRPLSLQLLPPAFARWRSACMSHATATTTATTKEQRP